LLLELSRAGAEIIKFPKTGSGQPEMPIQKQYSDDGEYKSRRNFVVFWTALLKKNHKFGKI
jgi:hypothetical protein